MSIAQFTDAALKVALAVVFAAFGTAKFFPYEAAAVAPMMAAHPLLAWLPAILGESGAARALGAFELATALLLLAGLASPLASVAGGAMGAWTFLVTCSMLVVLPGVFEPSAGGFPAVSGLGQFLLKDLVLLAASGAVLGAGLASARSRPTRAVVATRPDAR